jgi:hypothetical protein
MLRCLSASVLQTGKQLRQVFQLHLDEDMERLWECRNRLAPEPYDGDRDDEEELEMLESKRACSFLVQKQQQQPSPDRSGRPLL